jgi:hypothetical protein
MKTKEKAFELVDKYMNIRNVKLSDYSIIYLPTAKQCALIAVDEIIEATNMYQFGISNDKESIPPKVVNHPYWQEVKQEINNL